MNNAQLAITTGLFVIMAICVIIGVAFAPREVSRPRFGGQGSETIASGNARLSRFALLIALLTGTAEAVYVLITVF